MPLTRIHVYRTPKGKLRVLAQANGSLAERGSSAFWDGFSTLVTGQPPNRYGATSWVATNAKVKVTR